MSTTEFDAHLTTLYAHARAQMPGVATLVLLHIGAEQTGVALGAGATPQALLTLAIGAQKTARDHFKHTPPSPLELENAIVTVEDEVTRAQPLRPAQAQLVSSDAAIREIAALAGISAGPTMHLSLQAMEHTFNRLVLVTQGRPAAFEGLPDSPQFAATLLILREFMHHLQFAGITVLASPQVE